MKFRNFFLQQINKIYSYFSNWLYLRSFFWEGGDLIDNFHVRIKFLLFFLKSKLTKLRFFLLLTNEWILWYFSPDRLIKFAIFLCEEIKKLKKLMIFFAYNWWNSQIFLDINCKFNSQFNFVTDWWSTFFFTTEKISLTFF